MPAQPARPACAVRSGRVGSTAWRVIDAIAEVGLLAALRAARATARVRAVALGVGPAGPLVIDLDATLVAAHSDKDGTGGIYKGGFGFHPLLAYLDCPDGEAGGMALAGRLQPGNAGANGAPSIEGQYAGSRCWPGYSGRRSHR